MDLLHENKAVYPRKLGHQTATSNSKGMLLGCHAVEVKIEVCNANLDLSVVVDVLSNTCINFEVPKSS